MSTLLLRLAGPLQSWGDSSRFTRRETRQWPTKSGVLGLLAAATGRRRTDSIEDLITLRFGVRMDQPGRLIRDFQTARPLGAAHAGLSNRYYIADAVFVAGVEGDPALIGGLEEAVRAPAFPLFLGRRSCPPAGAVSLGVVHADVEDSLRRCEWQASPWFRRMAPSTVALELFVDALGGDSEVVHTVRDVPVSFNSERRQYGWRDVIQPSPETKANPDARRASADWFSAVMGV